MGREPDDLSLDPRSPQGSAVPEDAAQGLGPVINSVLTWKWHILTVTAIAFFGAFFATSLIRDYYVAETQVIVQKSGDESKVVNQMAVEEFTGRDDEYYGTQIAIMTGTKILKRIEEIYKLSSADYKVTTQRPRTARVIKLAVQTHDASLAADIANKIIELYIESKREEELFIARQMLGWLPDEDVKAVLGTDTVPADPQNAGQSTDFIKTVVEDPMMQRLKNDRMDIASKIEELSQRYKPKHPTMKELNQKLTYVDSQIQEQRARILKNLRSSLQGAYQITNINVLSRAEPSDAPAGPPRLKLILLTTIIAFLLTSYGCHLYETGNHTIRSEDDVMGMIPFLGATTRAKELDPTRKENYDPYTKAPRDLIDIAKDSATMADEVASIRTRILFSMPQEHSKTILITSTIPNEGKTTFSTLLALSFALLGERVLLLDGDLRRPSVGDHLQMVNEKGLSDHLTGQMELDPIIRATKLPELKVITGGTISINPAELLASAKMQTLIDTLKLRFDRIIIDAPPSLHIPDAMVMGRYADSRVMLCGAGMVERKTAEKVIHKFRSNFTPLVGLVINKSDIAKHKSHHKYYAAYKAYYGQSLG